MYTLRGFDVFFMVFGGATYGSKNENNCRLKGFWMVFTVYDTLPNMGVYPKGF